MPYISSNQHSAHFCAHSQGIQRGEHMIEPVHCPSMNQTQPSDGIFFFFPSKANFIVALSQGTSLQVLQQRRDGVRGSCWAPQHVHHIQTQTVVLPQSLRPGAPDSSSLTYQFFRSGCGSGCGFGLSGRAPFEMVSHCLLFFFHLFFLGSSCLLLGCQPLDQLDGHLLLQGHINLYTDLQSLH